MNVEVGGEKIILSEYVCFVYVCLERNACVTHVCSLSFCSTSLREREKGVSIFARVKWINLLEIHIREAFRSVYWGMVIAANG